MEISGMINQFMTSSYDAPAFASGRTQVVQSFVGNNQYNYTTNDGNQLSNLLSVTPQIKASLQNFWMTQLVVSIFSSALTDVLSSCDFTIKLDEKIPKAAEKEKKINKFLSDIDLKTHLINTLEESLFWGSYAWYVDYEKNKLVDLICSTNLTQIRSGTEPYKYISTLAATKSPQEVTNTTANKLSENIIRAEKICYVSFSPKRYKAVSKKDEDILRKEELEKVPQEDLFLAKNKVLFSYYIGQGICDDILMLLAEYLIKYMLQYITSLKVNIRPDVLMANLAQGATNVKDTTEAVQSIEACLNNSDSDISIFNLDLSRILYQAQQTLSAGFKVVPGIQNYSNFQLIEYPDWKTKLEQLNNDLDDLSKSIYGKKGIPQEMVDGGTSNRWEVIQRSARLLTTIEGLLSDLITTVKLTVDNFHFFTYGSHIPHEQIDFNMDSSNIIYNTSYNSKMESVANKVDNVNRIIGAYDSMIQNKKLNSIEISNWIRNQLASVDPRLSAAILKVTTKDDDDSADKFDKSDTEFEESL